MIPNNSVWLCSTHPKPSTTFRGWLARFGRNRAQWTVAWSARKTAGCRGRRGAVRWAGPKSKKIGARHGVLGPWPPGVRNAGNVAPFNAGPVLCPVLKTDKKLSINRSVFHVGGTYIEPDIETCGVLRKKAWNRCAGMPRRKARRRQSRAAAGPVVGGLEAPGLWGQGRMRSLGLFGRAAWSGC